MNALDYILPANRMPREELEIPQPLPQSEALLRVLLHLAQQCGVVNWIILPNEPDRIYLYWLDGQLHPAVETHLRNQPGPRVLIRKSNGPMLHLDGITKFYSPVEALRRDAINDMWRNLESFDMTLAELTRDLTLRLTMGLESSKPAPAKRKIPTGPIPPAIAQSIDAHFQRAKEKGTWIVCYNTPELHRRHEART